MGKMPSMDAITADVGATVCPVRSLRDKHECDDNCALANGMPFGDYRVSCATSMYVHTLPKIICSFLT